MTWLALVLIVFSSVLHAGWNLLAKRAMGGLAFTWLFSAASVVLYLPVAVYVFWSQRPVINMTTVVFVLGSTAIHIAYYAFLQRGYRLGDMSLVYPLSRGTSPLLTTVVAIGFLGETLTALALIGVGLIVVSTLILGYTGVKRSPAARAPIGLGLLTGVIIATYTLWDRHAVGVLMIPPLLYDWSCNLGRTLTLTPFALRRFSEVRTAWRTVRFEALGIALLSPLGYILILTAMTFTQVSYVAPARELSILVGTLMGGRLLQEGYLRQRSLAAGVMVLGVILLMFN